MVGQFKITSQQGRSQALAIQGREQKRIPSWMFSSDLIETGSGSARDHRTFNNVPRIVSKSYEGFERKITAKLKNSRNSRQHVVKNKAST